MHIENRIFRLMAPRRADLSGRPLGFLLLLFPREGAGRFSPLGNKEIGFYIPWFQRREVVECVQLADEKPPSQDWRKWPKQHRDSVAAAVARCQTERGMKVKAEWSAYDKRVDLSGSPWQMYYAAEFVAA